MPASLRPPVLVLALLLLLLVTPPTAVGAAGNIVVATPKAPVGADGDVAGRPTDINLVLDRSLDPQVAGRTLLTAALVTASWLSRSFGDPGSTEGTASSKIAR